jgi:hypothetical protein
LEAATRGRRRQAVVQAVRAGLRHDAIEWGFRFRPSFAELLFLLPFFGSIAVVASRADRRLFRFLTAEDHLLEWLQFVGFAVACVLAVLAGLRLARDGRTLPGLAFVVFALGCFLIAGEEIAWGQRILGFETPEGLEEINEQRETTVHNIGSVQDAANVVFALAGLYGAATPWLGRWRPLPWATRRDGGLFVPPLFLSSFFLVVFGYKALRYLLFPESGYTVTKIGEWPEFCLAFAFAAFSFFVWRTVTTRFDEVAAPVARRGRGAAGFR